MKRILAAAALLAAIFFVVSGNGPDEVPERSQADAQPDAVDVHVLRATAQQDMIRAFGQVQARWQVSLQSEVTGRVIEVTDKALIGALVAKGETLAIIEDTAQRLDLANRTAALAAAERALAEEQQRARIAEDNWRAAGYEGAPDPLVLRQPQLAEAEAQLDSARLAVARSRYMLDQTRITAPFDGAITRRSVSPGDLLQSGAEIVELYDTTRMDVVLRLTEAELARLSDDPMARVRLISDQSGKSWQGVIERVGRQVDNTNRWVDLIVSVTDPEGLLPGQFLRAEIDGQDYTRVFGIPQSFLGRDGAVWLVDNDDRLQRLPVSPAFTRDGISFVEPGASWPPTLRLTPPSARHLAGVHVMPVLRDEAGGISMADSEAGQ